MSRPLVDAVAGAFCLADELSPFTSLLTCS